MSPTLSPRLSIFGLTAVAGLASFLAAPPRAVAADLDAGYADVPPPIQQQVTFGSGWYVRGDIAATDDMYRVLASQSTTADVTFVNINRTSNAAYDLSLGGGYSFLNSFRADIVADLNQPAQYRLYNAPCYNKTTCNSSTRFNRYDALINGYYDFPTWSIVTPYVGAGIGVGFGNITTDVYPASGSAKQGYIGYFNFAWAAMAGVALDVYPHVKVDIGYRFIDEGHVYNKTLYNNELRAGLRYMIDN